MKSIILLNSNENTHQVEEEEKSAFVKTILNKIGLPIQEIWSEDELSLDNKIKLRAVLASYNISVVDDRDGELKVYLEKDVIAEWKKPSYILKRDLSAFEPKKKLFLEMTLEYTSVFDQTDV